jgi:hypothetical protein
VAGREPWCEVPGGYFLGKMRGRGGARRGGNQRSFGARRQGREGDNDGCTARVTKEGNVMYTY